MAFTRAVAWSTDPGKRVCSGSTYIFELPGFKLCKQYGRLTAGTNRNGLSNPVARPLSDPIQTPEQTPAQTTAQIEGFLLSRHWRDTRQGIELSLWAHTEQGPLKILVPATEAVCFIERDIELPLPPLCRRQAVDLSVLNGGTVDALYFQNQRQLNDLRSQFNQLNESDIKPADRYLMERFITAGFTATGNLSDAGTHLELIQPKLEPSDYLPPLTMLSLDIETRGFTDDLYSIAGVCGENKRVFMIGTDPDPQLEQYDLKFSTSETQLLNAFFDWVEALDPDVLIGWSIVNFDLNFIDKKCRALGIPFRLGRGGEPAAVLQPGNENQPRVARIPGRPVLDGIDLLKAGFWIFESYSLENVSRQLLGTGKLIQSDEDKLAEINRLFRTDKVQLANYNVRDCELVVEIFQHANLLPFAMQRSAITGLPLDRMGGSVAAFDYLYLPKLHRKGYVAPDIRADSGGLGSPGGYVLDSIPGLYSNVLLLDFKSLYPSIVRTFFIDPLGLAVPGEDPIEGFLGAQFSRTEHILPALIENLWSKRDQAKEQKDAALSQAIKIIMNSFYGVLGSSGCRFHSQQLASSITRRGHEIITRTRDFIEDAGYTVIYGDTDSVFVKLEDNVDEHEAASTGKSLMHSLNAWWEKNLADEHNLESCLEVEFETHYLKFLMPTVRGTTTGSKKRYAGLVRKNKTDLELVFKGLEAVRTDWTPLAREFQRELFRRVFFEEPYQAYVLETAQQLKAGQLDEQLVYRKRLRRKLADYQKNVPPHVQAARKEKRPGHWVSYIITRNGPEPVSNLQSAPDYQHYLDKQLAPAADSMLNFLDTSFAQITDAQMQMF